MRLLGMIFASLIMLVMLCAPALAQSAPSACQYRPGPCPSGATIQSLDDGADAFAQNGARGTDAVNDAMEDVPSPADAPAVPGDASVPAAPADSEGSPAGYESGGPGGTTVLPETGGAPLAALGSGILLVVFSLIAYRSAGR